MTPFRSLAVLVWISVSLLSAGAQNPPAKKEAFKPTDEEQAIVDLTNKEREKLKLPPLKANEKLFQAAKVHSANMAKQNMLVHELDGKNPAHRVRSTGYVYAFVGENVAWNQRSPEQLLKEWMESEHHRANILDRRFREIGIGIAKNDKGEPYYTQVFGTPRGR
jgi:uncharacterized protein YkwD